MKSAVGRLILTLAAASLSSCTLLANSTETSPQMESKFSAFIGEWTLKDDRFQQVWDGETVETLTIPNHFTKCDSLNTQYSVICVVDAGDLKGQIYWAYDSQTQKLHHLSHFGTQRIGTGTGAIDERQNLKNKVAFADEPKGTYRIYEYVWVNPNEYTMVSRQYNENDTATGNWYGGTFVRLQTL